MFSFFIMKLLFFIIFAFILLLPNSIYATQFIYEPTANPESEKAKQQIENYCNYTEKPNIEKDLFYNNSTHFISTKDCKYLEMPNCGPGTAFVSGLCVGLVKEPSQGDCLIATASFGSELAPQVQMLREVRDNVLLTTYSGALFMDGFNSAYYSFSPQVAQLENENPIFKEGIKIFITPMISTLSIMTLADEGSESEVIFFGVSTIGLIVGMYIITPAIVVWQVRKRI